MTPGEIILLIPVAMVSVFAGVAVLFMGIASLYDLCARK